MSKESSVGLSNLKNVTDLNISNSMMINSAIGVDAMVEIKTMKNLTALNILQDVGTLIMIAYFTYRI